MGSQKFFSFIHKETIFFSFYLEDKVFLCSVLYLIPLSSFFLLLSLFSIFFSTQSCFISFIQCFCIMSIFRTGITSLSWVHGWISSFAYPHTCLYLNVPPGQKGTWPGSACKCQAEGKIPAQTLTGFTFLTIKQSKDKAVCTWAQKPIMCGAASL